MNYSDVLNYEIGFYLILKNLLDDNIISAEKYEEMDHHVGMLKELKFNEEMELLDEGKPTVDWDQIPPPNSEHPTKHTRDNTYFYPSTQ